jgi:hypothetical protein
MYIYMCMCMYVCTCVRTYHVGCWSSVFEVTEALSSSVTADTYWKYGEGREGVMGVHDVRCMNIIVM